MRIIALAALPLALAACSGEPSGNAAAPAAPVAAVAAPAGQNWTETVVKTDEGYRMGNPTAAIKLIEYGARTCPTCGAFAREAMTPLAQTYVASGKVSFEFRDYLVHGAPDLALAVLGQCGGTAPFFPILEQMYGAQATFLDRLQATPPAVQQQISAQPPTQALATIAQQMGAIDFVKQRGITDVKARACLSTQATLDAVAKPTETATQAGTVTGTPTFLINGNAVANTVTWGQLEQALKRAGA